MSKWLALALFSGVLAAQQTSTTPDLRLAPAVAQFSTCSGTGSTPIYLGTNPAVRFRLTFYVDGTNFTAASVGIQGAPAATGGPTGTAGTFTSTTNITLVEGSVSPLANPIASAAQGTIVVSMYYPWVRVLCNSATGSGGTVYYTLWGYDGTSTALSQGGAASPTSNVNIVQVASVNTPGNDGDLPVDAGQAALAVATWTSATPQNTTLTVNTTGFPVTGMTFMNTGGALTGGVLTFEESNDGGATYYPVTASRVGSSGVDNTFSLSGAGNQMWTVPTVATTQYRVRLSTVISGAGNAVIGLITQNAPGHVDNVIAIEQGQNVPAADGTSNTAAFPLYSVNGVSTSGTSRVFPFNFNGSTWDRQKGSGGYLEAWTGDPCQNPANQPKTRFVINLTGGGVIISGTSAKKTYICSLNILTATAQNIALVEGTGSVCGTNTVGMAGGATAATGWNFAANGGLTHGAGNGTVYSTSVNADDVCLLLSSTGQTSGSGEYVQQ